MSHLAGEKTFKSSSRLFCRFNLTNFFTQELISKLYCIDKLAFFKITKFAMLMFSKVQPSINQQP